MKVLQINAVYNLSSTGRNVTESHLLMLEKGIDSYVAYSKTNKPDDPNLYHIGSALDVKLHGLLSRISGKQGYFSHLATRNLVKYIDKIKPDVVHLHNLHGNYINLPMLMKYLDDKKVPVVITFHDFWFITGKCMYFTTSNCEKWQEQCGNCPNLQDGNITWFFDKTEELLKDKTQMFSKTDKLALVGVSKWATDEVCKSPIARYADIVKPIYNWVDISKFYPRDIKKARDKYGINGFMAIGVSSIWSERKGLKSFIELAEKMPEITVVLVGTINEGLELPKNIITVPSTSSIDELAELYSSADVFITFSLEETFGKVSAEALSCGTPVICYDSTANPEIVGEGCGYVCEKRNLNQVVESIKKIENKGKDFYRDNCLKYVYDNFEKEKKIGEYIDLYKEISDKN
jgi:glycosyltransferase involved in cell wall biosynthesis